MSSKVQLNKYTKGVCFFFSACILLLAFYTLHDLQTADGVGLYLAIINGQENHKRFDVLVDIIGFLLLVAGLVLPCILFKRSKAESFFHMTTLYFAFIPTVSPGSTVHLLDTIRNLGIRPTLSDGSYMTAFLESFSTVKELFLMIIPFMLLCIAINREAKPSSLKAGEKIVITLESLLLILNLLFPTISENITYIMFYLLVVWIFAELEMLCDHFPVFSKWGNILYGGCMLRGIYRMIELMSTANI